MKQIITFDFKGKNYKFERPYNNPKEDSLTSLKWIHECYKSIGAKPKQATNRFVKITGKDGFNWCRYIA